MASRKVTVPNGSELNVPNRSELAKAMGTHAANGVAVAHGRPPVLTDEQLDEVAIKLNDVLGRPPRLEELIAESGGCQRQRASRSIQRLREGLATRAIKSTLALPPAIEGELRQWIDRILSLSAAQLAGEHAQMVADHETARQAAQDLLDEQQVVIRDLRERLADQQRIGAELVSETQRLKTENMQIGAEKAIAIALADDRQRLLDKFAETRRAGSPAAS